MCNNGRLSIISSQLCYGVSLTSEPGLMAWPSSSWVRTFLSVKSVALMDCHRLNFLFPFGVAFVALFTLPKIYETYQVSSNYCWFLSSALHSLCLILLSTATDWPLRGHRRFPNKRACEQVRGDPSLWESVFVVSISSDLIHAWFLFSRIKAKIPVGKKPKQQ